MTQFTNITLNDGQATPVVHTFTARRITPDGVARWQDISGGIAAGFITLEANLREPVPNKSGIPCYKARLKLMVPTLEVVTASTYNGITPAPTKAYDCAFDGEFLFPARAGTQERKNLVAYVKSALSQVDIQALLFDLNFVY